MHNYNYSTVINCSAIEICQTILAVEQYPDFLPFILKAKTYQIYTEEHKDSLLKNSSHYCFSDDHSYKKSLTDYTKQNFKADLTVGYGGINYTYRSLIQYQSMNNQQADIIVQAEKGIFDWLHNNWHIEQINDTCIVNFSLKFCLKSKMLELILLPVLDRVAKQTINCFKERIHQKNTNRLL